MTARAIVLATALLATPAIAAAQSPCLGTAAPRDSVSALADCLSDPNPQVRDGIAFESLSKLLRSGGVDAAGLRRLRDRLVVTVSRGGSALQTSFPALTLSEIARTDRVKPWMTPQASQRAGVLAERFCHRDDERRRRHPAIAGAGSRIAHVSTVGTVLALTGACHFAPINHQPSGLFRYSF